MEQIYTIPVNEAFDACMKEGVYECPLCKMYEVLEKKELDYSLGPAMMEPNTRIKMNEQGFCHTHFEKMAKMDNKLSLALILESHINELKGKLEGNFFERLFGNTYKTHIKLVKYQNENCFICERIEYHFKRMLDTILYLYKTERAFKSKVAGQRVFCLPHYKELLELCKAQLTGENFKEIFDITSEIQRKYFEKISGDVSWFCKKFDYRYKDEPWGDSKDSIVRAIALLSGK